MKILIGVHHFPPHYTGGAELRAYRTAAWLQAHGHDVRVVCVEAIDATEDGLAFTDETYDGLPVRRLYFDLAAGGDPFRWQYDNPWIGAHLRGYLRQHKPDLLHLIGGYLLSGSALRAAMDLQIPTVLTLTDFWFLCPRINLLRSDGSLCHPPFEASTCVRCLGERKRRYRLPGRVVPGLMTAFWRGRRARVLQIEARMDFLLETLSGVDAIISPSRFLRELFVYAGVAEERIVFSRQGRDFDLLPEQLQKQPRRSASTPLRVGYMGQITPHKGVHVLFESLRHLPNANLEVQVYGDTAPFPRYARRLRRMAARDPRLHLAGVYERTEVSRVLRELDVVVVPSLWYENSPNVILEAFAHRTPVIVSDLGGMAELVEEGVNGLCFPPGEAASLATALRRLIEEPGLLARLRAGIKPVKTVAEEMTELQAIYRAVVKQ